MEVWGLYTVLSGVIIVCLLFHRYISMWLNTERARRKLAKQGIKGPPPSILYGNLPEMQRLQHHAMKKTTFSDSNELITHDYSSSLFPYFEHWRKQYGQVYTYSTGTKQHLYVNKPELIKEMNQSMTMDLGKPTYSNKSLAPMLGNGVLRSNGPFWAQQRKIIAPEFFMDKVKGMMGLMVESAQPILRKWEESMVEGKAEIKVDVDLRGLSANVIARACFGSSYSKGKQIFSKLRSLQKAISKRSNVFGVTISAGRLSATENGIRNLEREIDSLIWETVKEREQECLQRSSSGKDLMQLILEGALNDPNLDEESSKRFIIDNCKNIYFAGHESTAVAASWCLMLLALHPEWQDQIRMELSQVCKGNELQFDQLPHLKSVTMVIQESLRLYPPAAFVAREALEETQLGNLRIPKGVGLWTLVPTLHRDPEIWGSDANVFKPARFAEGVTKACKTPQAYVPFGVGPRLCLGKNFAMVQLKVILLLIVSRFSFSLSPKYRHSPKYRMIVEPGHGVYIMFQKM